MNSSEWLDNDIDDIFKASAEAYAPPYDPNAWAKMEQKLNAYTDLNYWYRGLVFSTILAIVCLMLFLGLLNGHNTLNTADLNISNRIQAENVEDTAIPSGFENEKENNPADKSSIALFNKSNSLAKDENTNAIPVAEAEPDLSTTQVEKYRVYSPLVLLNSRPEELVFMEIKINPYPIEKVEEAEEIIPTEHNIPRWGIGLMFAPDLSSVGLNNFTSPGINVGLSLEYRLNPKLSINGGLLYGVKKYETKGEDYTVPPGFWDTRGTPDLIQAQCDVLDIQLNIGWRIYEGPKSIVSVSTGFSSYLMLREDYEYEGGYLYPGGDWSISNENQHFFGIYNIAIAYARPLGEQLHFQVEPFMKIPISEIGYGQVDLNSTGLMFSLKYWMKNNK